MIHKRFARLIIRRRRRSDKRTAVFPRAWSDEAEKCSVTTGKTDPLLAESVIRWSGICSQIQKTCHLLLLTNAWQYIKLATDSISCILWYKKCGLAPLFSGTCPHFYFLFRIFTCYILCSPESIFYIQPRMIQVHIHERFPLPLWIQALLSVQDVHYILLLSEPFPRY